MKSEHRHELETNSLAVYLATLPDTLRKHSSKILTVLALIMLVFAVFNYRRNQQIRRDLEVREALAGAWNVLGSLRGVDPRLSDAEMKARLDEARSEVSARLKLVFDQTDASDKDRRASAALVTGELNWELSQMISRGGATTRPAEYTEAAKTAYETLVKDYPDQTLPVTIARFGLAAIAEDNHDWEGARSQYKQIIESPQSLPAYRTQAERRISALDEYQKPLLLLPPVKVETPAQKGELLQDLSNLESLKANYGDVAPTTVPTSQP